MDSRYRCDQVRRTGTALATHPQGSGADTALTRNVAGVVAVAVLSPNQAVAAVDDQLTAIAGSLLASGGNSLSLGGFDNGGALSAS
jgi:hypothetical protein